MDVTRIDQIAIEFHGVDDLRFIRAMWKLKRRFHVAHLHWGEWAWQSRGRFEWRRRSGVRALGRFIADGADPVGSTPDEFRKFIANEIDKWTKVVKAAGIKVEF